LRSCENEEGKTKEDELEGIPGHASLHLPQHSHTVGG